ncbi:MAG: glycerophosphodiester phosphodiesterase [Acidimicrobiaceae bacterium]|nr:glycerophosphodiester phosphodiesterase [Acidimicrobiaceae bacterium]
MGRPPPSQLPIGFAHRGARAECPDNTLASFARALELGARALESDAWITADDEAVLDHDGVVREWWRRRPIAALPVGALPPHIPRLSDLYEASGAEFELSLDVKDPAAARVVVAVAERYGAAGRLWLCSSDIDRLGSWREQWAKVRVVASTQRDSLGARALADMAGRGVDAVNLREREWDQGLLDDVHDAGMLAFGWDAQTDRALDRLLGLGIDAVYSDHVARMVDALRLRTR